MVPAEFIAHAGTYVIAIDGTLDLCAYSGGSKPAGPDYVCPTVVSASTTLGPGQVHNAMLPAAISSWAQRVDSKVVDGAGTVTLGVDGSITVTQGSHSVSTYCRNVAGVAHVSEACIVIALTADVIQFNALYQPSDASEPNTSSEASVTLQRQSNGSWALFKTSQYLSVTTTDKASAPYNQARTDIFFH